MKLYHQKIRALRHAILVGAIFLSTPAMAETYDLVLDSHMINVTGKERPAMLINGQLPGPVLRFKEGEDVTIRVTNRLKEPTSIHWHGLILPSEQDGVAGISNSFPGIAPGETYTYTFPVVQAGTYWYHSHSATQEQSGIYAPIVIEPAKREPFRYDREYIVMLSDWTDENPDGIIRNLKLYPGYYNNNKRTLMDFFRDAKKEGIGAALRPQDVGRHAHGPHRHRRCQRLHLPDQRQVARAELHGLFKPGERVRLRFINAAAMSYFDVRIPGLKMTVVQADGNNVQPVPVDEFRIAVAETYDVLVQPREDKAFSILAESIDRTGFARATLAPREGMVGEIPAHRPRPLLTMADMGSSFGPTGLDRGTDNPETDAPGHVAPMDMDHGSMAGMDHGGSTAKPADGKAGAMEQTTPGRAAGAASGKGGMRDTRCRRHAPPCRHGPFRDGPWTRRAGSVEQRYGRARGSQGSFLRDLKAFASPYDAREPDRVIEIRLTGNMERFIWSINGRKYSEAQPIVLRHNERVRFRFINETMMNHPMHLHGMWMLPRVGNGASDPMKHVVNIKPGTHWTWIFPPTR